MRSIHHLPLFSAQSSFLLVKHVEIRSLVPAMPYLSAHPCISPGGLIHDVLASPDIDVL